MLNLGSTQANATLIVSGGITGTGNVAFAGANNGRSGDNTVISGATVNNVGTISNTENNNTGTDTISAVIGLNVTGLIQNSIKANLVLSGNNSGANFFGDTTLTNGTINVQNANALANSVVNTNGTAGALTFGATTTNITAVQIGGLNGSGSATAGSFGNIVLVNSGASAGALALSIGNSNVANGSSGNPNTLNPTYSGIISGAGSITKAGTNTQTLSGASTYTGSTSIITGTLTVTGSISTSSLTTVGGNATSGTPTLTGTGTVGALTVSAAGTGVIGTVNPGTVGGIGTLKAGATTLAGTYACDVSGTSSDLLAVTGNLNISAATLNVVGTLSAASYTIATYTGTLTGSTFAAGVPSGYHIDTASSTQVKLVQNGAPAGYATWATGKGLDGSNNGSTQDPNNNGIPNLMEYVLNGSPKNAESPAAILPTLDSSGANFVFTYHRLDDSLADTVQTFQYGSDLAGWTSLLVPATSGSVGAATVTVTDGSPADTVVISIPKTVAVGGKLFGRLQAVK